MPEFELEPYWQNDLVEIYNWDGRRTQFLDDGSLDMVLTSPPYYKCDHLWKDLWEALGIKDFNTYNRWMQGFYDEWYRLLGDGRYVILNTSNVNEQDDSYNNKAWTSVGLEKAGFSFIDEIIWEKHKATSQRFGVLVQHPQPRMYYPNNVHEVWLVYRKGKAVHDHTKWTEESKVNVENAKRVRNDVWRFGTQSAQKLGFGGGGAKHVAPFPPDIVWWFIHLYTFPGEVVMDPFAGGGTAGYVAMLNKRRSVMIEIDQNNCDLMIERFEEVGMMDVGEEENQQDGEAETV